MLPSWGQRVTKAGSPHTGPLFGGHSSKGVTDTSSATSYRTSLEDPFSKPSVTRGLTAVVQTGWQYWNLKQIDKEGSGKRKMQQKLQIW